MDRFRRVGTVVMGLAILLVAVLFVSASIGSSGGSYSPPTEEQLAAHVPVEQVLADPKRDVASGLRSPGNGKHPAALIDINEIRSGGPPPDGIPPLDNPLFMRVGEIDWVEPTEPVVVVTVEGPDGVETRGYPVQVLTWHEIVNDSVAGRPITVSYCPLCNSAVVVDRQLADGTIVDFGTSGSLYRSSLLMYDRQTESLWTHFDGRAVVGFLAGEELVRLPGVMTSWEEFAAAHPQALVLSRVTGWNRNYGDNPYRDYDVANSRPLLYEGGIDERLLAKERVVVARRAGVSVTVRREGLTESGVHETSLGGSRVAFLHRPGTSSALDTTSIAEGRDVGSVAVYELTPDITDLSRRSDDTFVSDDGSIWNLYGEAIDGPQAGTALVAIEHVDTFWFAIAAFDPDTRLETP